jgi:Protein of unknown function (DUF3592)
VIRQIVHDVRILLMNRARNGKSKRWRLSIALTLLFLASGLGVYLVHIGSTHSWPQTGCTIVGSRVVRDDLQDQSRFTVLFRGEYRLRYLADGHEYFVWARSGWKDVDQHFVQSKLDQASNHCDFRVRYNPAHPSEAIAFPK